VALDLLLPYDQLPSPSFALSTVLKSLNPLFDLSKMDELDVSVNNRLRVPLGRSIMRLVTRALATLGDYLFV
jgi:hypothetical protein